MCYLTLSLMSPVLLFYESIVSNFVLLGAIMFDYHLLALLTLYCAAPMELAVTTANDLNLLFFHFQAAFSTKPSAASPLPLRQIFTTL